MAYENRDYTHLTESEKKNINLIAEAIRNKAYGIDVRESIALAIELMLEIFSKENNDAYAEVVKARNEFGSLDERLDDMLADKQNISVSQINKNLGKIDQAYLTDELIAQIAGTAAINAVPADNSITTSKYVNDSVTADKISSDSENLNVFDKTKVTTGSYLYAGAKGYTSVTYSNAEYSGLTSLIPVNVGDVINFNAVRGRAYFVPVDENGKATRPGINITTAQAITRTIEAGEVGFYTANHNTLIDNYMITINHEMPSEYVSYGVAQTKVLNWLDYKPKSIKVGHLSDEVKTVLSQSNEYFGKSGIITGDSIVWNTGQVHNGETLIGYDGVLKRELGLASIERYGYSGRPLSSGSANGSGIYDNFIQENIDFSDKKFLAIAAGTNDNKLDMSIGAIQPFGSTFDTTTYIGAMQALIEYAKSKNRKIEIVIMAPTQRNNGGYMTETTNSAGHMLIDYVNAARAVSQKYSATFSDLYSESGITELTIDLYTYDGLHLINTGYEATGGLTADKMKYK